MKFVTLPIATLLVGGLTALPLMASDSPHWSYHDQTGPSHWAELTPDFGLCSSGKNQSPVNLSGMIESVLPELEFNYKASRHDSIVNNGHTIQVNVQPGSVLNVDGHLYELKQFHFHAPSENHLNGKAFPLEVHYVHADSDGNLAVLAELYNIGADNTALNPIWQQLPASPGDAQPLDTMIDPLDLLPNRHDYYRFNGSLTTPPCSEGVLWMVLKHQGTVSSAQLAAFTQLLTEPNNRPLQPLNARMIAE